MKNLELKILDILRSGDYHPLKPKELAGLLRLTKKNMEEFRATLESMERSGLIRIGKKGRIRLKSAAGLVAGVVRKIASGAGFVIPSDPTPELKGGDVYVSARDLRDAHTGDEVLVRLTDRRRSGGQRCGVVEKILDRATNIFVGTYFERGAQGFVRVDGTVFQDAIHVGDPGAKGAVNDDKVVIEMVRFPTATRSGEAVLTQVLGKRGDPGVDTLTVVHTLGLPHEFSEEVLEDARHQAQRFDENKLGRRRDLTSETIITIDPADARDFDDAISLTRDRKSGHWQLGVHIADVSHFVTPDSPMDREARLRGTSVYLPRHVIPMLPEVVSNGLASLQEGQVRLTKSVFIGFDAAGSVTGVDIANSAIRVARRFAYEEVMPIIRNPKQSFPRLTADVRHLLEQMFELAMLLRKRRFENGALQMGIPEVEIDFDPDGHVAGAHERHHDESHEIIEEFMLAANIAIATLLSSKEIPFLRRIHGEPDELKLKNFQEFCRGLGYDVKQFQSRFALQQVVRDATGRPEERAINFALLRSMKQAAYAPEEYGHYALAEEDYCHFTSPIRRYPDLTIHRLIGELADGRTPVTDSMASLVELGKRCSSTERRAEKAERELIRIKLLRYMSERIGEEMDAFITGVENFGLFCQGITIPAEGLVHTSALVDDFYVFDSVSRTLTGERHKHVYRLGDPIRVLVARVDVDRRQLDLRIVDGRNADQQPAAPASGAKRTRSRGEQHTGRRGSRSAGAADQSPPKRRKPSGGAQRKRKQR